MTKIETDVIEKLANSQVGESLKQAVLKLLASHGRTTANHKACLEKIKELNEKLSVDNVVEA
jgi:alkyl hydroperoxide reductase subunit AhpF